MSEYYRELLFVTFQLLRYYENVAKEEYDEIGFRISNEEVTGTISFNDDLSMNLSIYCKDVDEYIFSQKCVVNDEKLMFAQLKLFFTYLVDHNYIIPIERVLLVSNGSIMMSVLISELEDLLEQEGINYTFDIVEYDELYSVINDYEMVIFMPPVENVEEAIKKYGDKIFYTNTLK